MSQPPAYIRQYAFLDWSTAFPTTPHSGQHMDTEFNAAKVTIDQILVNMALLQRDDGKLHNGIVGADALGADVLSLMANWTPRGAWVTLTVYAVRDLVTQSGKTYVALIAHTAGVFATDLAAGKWMQLSSAAGIAPDGSTAVTANIPWGGFKITGLGNATAGGDAVNKTVMDAAIAAAAVPSAAEGTKGKIAIALQATVDAGTDDIDALTSKKLHDSVYNVDGVIIPITGEATAVSTGTAKKTWRQPYKGLGLYVRASLVTAQATGSILTIDINKNGVSILSTKLTIDNTEKTSVTAVAAAVISDTAWSDDAEWTVDVDQIGDGTAAGLKIEMVWRNIS